VRRRRWFALAIASLGISAGCGGGTATVRNRAGDGARLDVAPELLRAAAFPPRRPLARPGERMRYRLSLHGIDVASLAIVIGDVGELGGREVVVVQSGVEGSPLVSMVRKVESAFTSWIDTATSRPVLFRAAEDAEADDPTLEATDSELGAIVDGTFTVRVHRGDAVQAVERQVVGAAPVFDLNAFLIALRSWEAPAGTVAVADVVRSRYVWRTRVEVAGREEIATELGALPAVRLDGRSQRLRRDGAIDPASDIRAYSLWISDDADRVPLLLVARTAYGDIRMELTDYVP